MHINDGTIPAVGAGLKIAPGGTAAWTGTNGPHLWHGSAEIVPGRCAHDSPRPLGSRRYDAAWIGVTGGSKQVQVSHFEGSAWNGAKTLPALSASNYAIAGAGDGGHVLFAWHTLGGQPSRMAYADGRGPRFLTPAEQSGTRPRQSPWPRTAAPSSPGRSGVNPTTIIARVHAADGTWGLATPARRRQRSERRSDDDGRHARGGLAWC